LAGRIGAFLYRHLPSVLTERSRRNLEAEQPMPFIHASALVIGSDFKLTGTSISEFKTGLRQVLESRDATV
jgi:hypothetical protein